MTKHVRVGAIIVIIFALLAIAVYSLGYHGQREFNEGVALPDVQDVIDSARGLTGTPYDPWMGMHDNIGARAGFVVCSDVPNIAYGLEGFSWKEVLKRDFAVRPSAYDTRNGNTPANPYFHRRARNLYAYFVANDRLMDETYPPMPGDLVFYRKSPNGYIAHVTLVTERRGESYRVMESAPKTVLAQEVGAQEPIERGWIFAGTGKMY